MSKIIVGLVLSFVLLGASSSGLLAAPATPASENNPRAATNKPLLVGALQNITTLQRAGYRGYATVWDGNKYIQCGDTPRHGLRCEAAGAWMQPSLEHVLTPARLAGLTALGWRLDPSFGNYVQIFPTATPIDQVADRILLTLSSVYDADLADLQVESDWIKDEPCPPRNGPSQNLAGMINDARSMAPTAVRACAYLPSPSPVAVDSTAALIGLYGARVTGEIQRLRVNADREVFVAFDTDIGYVQCEPQKSPAAIYCEAQSADSWPALASVLTADRITRLHAMGFTDPGRVPNYWKAYPVDQVDDATIAREVLAVLHDVYGYAGSSPLTFATEKGEGR